MEAAKLCSSQSISPVRLESSGGSELLQTSWYQFKPPAIRNEDGAGIVITEGQC